MATLKQIADACGCSKPHVKDVLVRMGMWDGHAHKEGRGWAIDQEASQAAADAISREHGSADVTTPRKATARTERSGQVEAIRELYERLCSEKDKTIDDLRSRLAQAERERDQAILEAKEASDERDRWMSIEQEVMGRGLLARMMNRPPRGLIEAPRSQDPSGNDDPAQVTDD